MNISELPFWPNPQGYRNIDFGLQRVYQLLGRLDNPHLRIPPTIHIAGTNGKGSTLSYLKAIFEDCNLKVHCYTSPHLVRFNERIVLKGQEIDNELLQEILQKCQIAAEIYPPINVTFFEGITVAAFVAFCQVKADVLLLETGMGGRLDATNVIKNPLATIITPISFDHTDFLGKTLAKISYEKAGIIKVNSPVILGKQTKSALKVIKTSATKNNSKVFAFRENWSVKKIKTKQKEQMCFKFADKTLILPLPALLGDHQIENAGMAIMTVLIQEKWQISYKNIENGLKKASWQARLQKINQGKFYNILPNNFQLILDGGHNKAGAETISKWLNLNKKQEQANDLISKNYLICAMLKDKNIDKFLQSLAKQIEMIIALSIKNEEKSRDKKEVMESGSDLGIISKEAEDFTSAIEKIKQFHQENYSNQPAKIIICGSLYLAGQFLKENC